MKTRLLVALLVLGTWAVGLDGLAVYPLVGQDEPWIAAAPYKLATEGVFGSDLFAGYYGIEKHHYQHQPAFHLLQAGVFQLAGVGVFQMRFLPVTLGLLLLPLTFAVGRQMGGHRVGLLAVLLLCTLRFSGDLTTSGVPLLDIARINRYDVAVPVAGLAALWLFNRAERRGSLPLYAAAGAAAGLAGLFHLYGLFWLAVFWMILLRRQGLRTLRQPAPYLVLAGVLLAWTPWLLYIAGGWQDYLGQQRFVAGRFDVFNPGFYMQNLLTEVDRYRVVDLFDEVGRLQIARPGLWISVMGLLLGPVLMLRQRRGPVAALAMALALHLGLFTLLLKQKHFNYAIAFWPLAMLVLAWSGVWAWQRRRGLWRVGLALLLLLVMAEGLAGAGRRQMLARRVTPYADYTARVARHIPQGSRVLGLQHYWLGLRQYEYRTWLLPLFMADEALYDERLTLEEALEQVDPDVVLIDRHMAQLFSDMVEPAHSYHALLGEYQRFMRQRGAVLLGVVEDRDYGQIQVYWVGDR